MCNAFVILGYIIYLRKMKKYIYSQQVCLPFAILKLIPLIMFGVRTRKNNVSEKLGLWIVVVRVRQRKQINT